MAAENRKYKRHALAHKGMIYTTKGARIASCVLRNVSVGGAQLELKREIEWPKDICACALRDKVRFDGGARLCGNLQRCLELAL